MCRAYLSAVPVMDSWYVAMLDHRETQPSTALAFVGCGFGLWSKALGFGPSWALTSDLGPVHYILRLGLQGGDSSAGWVTEVYGTAGFSSPWILRCWQPHLTLDLTGRSVMCKDHCKAGK